MTATVKRSVPPPTLVKMGNPLVRMLLGSPLHGVADHVFLVLHLTGRKTGHRYNIPVGFVDLGGQLTVVTVARWRVNLRGGADVEVTQRGRRRPMHALLEEDPTSVAVSYQAMIDRMGWKKAQRQLGISRPGGRPPTLTELKDAADEYGWSVITLTPRGTAVAPSVDRASAADLMQSATGDGRAAGHIGAVIVLAAAPGFRVAEARRVLGERIRTVPRLRQRLRRPPPGCGRPYWADDPAFDIDEHVRQVRCPPPGNERALLDLAAAQLAEPMPRSRPLWSATFVTGLADGGTGLVVIMDHVLADGMAGLAVLGTLADQVAGTAQPQADRFPAPAPRVRELAADAWRGHWRRAGRAKPGAPRQARGLRRIRAGMAELGGARLPRRRPATSLNRPVGPRRRLDVVTVDLAAIRDLGHAHGGTVNDVVLAAVAGALRTLLAARGEQLGEVTVTVPVAARRAATGGELGNQIGIMPVTVPATGDFGARVTRTAELTRQRKSGARGASATLFVPAFLLLARTGLLRWFTNHQRIVQTFVTNLRGPDHPLTFGGATIRAIIPIPTTTGNVTVTFAASSYAGTLNITILSDPARMPDAPALVTALRRQLSAPPP